MTDFALLATAPLWGGTILGGLWFALASRGQWLVACLLLALAYVSLSLGLERPGAPAWLVGLRWGLFGATLAAWARYRWHPERHRSAKAPEASDGPGEPPEE